jgi:hypothetical protein
METLKIIIINFINLNLYYFIVYIILFIIVFYLIMTDDRFSLKKKMIFIIISFFFLALSIFIEKTPILIIKDLFWYSLTLNIGFIFHVLILDRIFYWAWKNRKTENKKKKERMEYLGFIISRISFTFSIWGFMYFIKESMYYFILSYIYKYFYIYDNKYMKKIYNFFHIIKYIILLILIYFSTIFHNYSNLLLSGNNNKITIKIILNNLLFFLIFFIIAIIIGIPRLYIIWIFYGLLELYKILTFKYDYFLYTSEKLNDLRKRNFKNKIIFILNNEWLSSFESCYEQKFEELDLISKTIYHKFFIFDLIKFINRNKFSGKYYEYWFSIPIKDKQKYEFPINKIYKFYLWEELVKGYIELIYNANLIESFDGTVDITEELTEFINLINGDEDLFYELYPKEEENNK